MEPPPKGRFAPCTVRDQRRKALAHFRSGIFHLHWYKYVDADLQERPHTVLLCGAVGSVRREITVGSFLLWEWGIFTRRRTG